jgi:rubredoxin
MNEENKKQRAQTDINWQRLVEYDSFFCDICRKYVYSELQGDKAAGIAPKTTVENLPPVFVCPTCGAEKKYLRAVTLLDSFFVQKTEPGLSRLKTSVTNGSRFDKRIIQ